MLPEALNGFVLLFWSLRRLENQMWDRWIDQKRLRFSAQNERGPKTREKCATGRNRQRIEQYIQCPEALDAKRCGSELCVQRAREIPRPRRFRIAIISPKNPNPISMRP